MENKNENHIDDEQVKNIVLFLQFYSIKEKKFFFKS